MNWMNIKTDKTYASRLAPVIEKSKEQVKEKYGLTPGNNVNLICEKLEQTRDLSGVFVECGVYRGHTLFSVATFMQERSIGRDIIGCDTFEGFPGASIDDRDHPLFFEQLYEHGIISRDHLLKAKKRTNDFQDISHLQQEYFVDVQQIFKIANDFEKIRLNKGAFNKSLSNIKEPVCILFIDCDLYGSYMDCLTQLYDAVVDNGVIIFDEYYSLKYPGAAWAVKTFFESKSGSFECYKTQEGFERWCYIKD